MRFIPSDTHLFQPLDLQNPFFLSSFNPDIHDVEYTSSLPIPPCNPTLVFSSPSIAKSYGLSPEDKGKIWGEGDQKILNALKVLKELKEEGKIKMIGICGELGSFDIFRSCRMRSMVERALWSWREKVMLGQQAKSVLLKNDITRSAAKWN